MDVAAHPEAAGGAGAVLRLIRSGDAVTRAALAQQTGLAREQRVDALLAAGLISYRARARPGGGRPRAAGSGLTALHIGRGRIEWPRRVVREGE